MLICNKCSEVHNIFTDTISAKITLNHYYFTGNVQTLRTITMPCTQNIGSCRTSRGIAPTILQKQCSRAWCAHRTIECCCKETTEGDQSHRLGVDFTVWKQDSGKRRNFRMAQRNRTGMCYQTFFFPFYAANSFHFFFPILSHSFPLFYFFFLWVNWKTNSSSTFAVMELIRKLTELLTESTKFAFHLF